jgi:hypothetical protein
MNTRVAEAIAALPEPERLLATAIDFEAIREASRGHGS